MNEPKTRITDEDRAIGLRLRRHRLVRGLTQKQLSALIGESAKQIYYFENAKSRVSGRKMLEISRALHIPISWLCSDVEEQEIVVSRGEVDDETHLLQRFVNTAEGYELNYHFNRISSSKKRELIVMLLDTIVAEQEA